MEPSSGVGSIPRTCRPGCFSSRTGTSRFRVPARSDFAQASGKLFYDFHKPLRHRCYFTLHLAGGKERRWKQRNLTVKCSLALVCWVPFHFKSDAQVMLTEKPKPWWSKSRRIIFLQPAGVAWVTEDSFHGLKGHVLRCDWEICCKKIAMTHNEAKWCNLVLDSPSPTQVCSSSCEQARAILVVGRRTKRQLLPPLAVKTSIWQRPVAYRRQQPCPPRQTFYYRNTYPWTGAQKATNDAVEMTSMKWFDCFLS